MKKLNPLPVHENSQQPKMNLLQFLEQFIHDQAKWCKQSLSALPPKTSAKISSSLSPLPQNTTPYPHKILTYTSVKKTSATTIVQLQKKFFPSALCDISFPLNISTTLTFESNDYQTFPPIIN